VQIYLLITEKTLEENLLRTFSSEEQILATVMQENVSDEILAPTEALGKLHHYLREIITE
jgi:hypothetical protein